MLICPFWFAACNLKTQDNDLCSNTDIETKADKIVVDSSSYLPKEYKVLKNAYPDFIDYYSSDTVYFKDGSNMVLDDKKDKSINDLLEQPDLKDIFHFDYKQLGYNDASTYLHDPGRVRNEAFMKKMYGATENEVKKNLVTIVWCPNLVNQKIKVTKVNGVDKAIQAVSAELDKHPELRPYLLNIGGTFNWRKISGTNRMSTHSFGMTIDINTRYADYWQWNCKCKNEGEKLKYRNRIPKIIVDIFEKHGFIWGGKWYHYDTMHFEYRPELI